MHTYLVIAFWHLKEVREAEQVFTNFNIKFKKYLFVKKRKTVFMEIKSESKLLNGLVGRLSHIVFLLCILVKDL